MACDLHCPNCGENLGKDTENFALASCGTCGENNIYNPRGETDGMTEAEIEIFNRKKKK